MGDISENSRNSILMTCQNPDLVVLWLVEANFQPIRRTTQIWVVKGHQYGIFVLISQTSFCRETSCGEMVKCWLFSQAVIRKGGKDYMIVFLTVCRTFILPYYSGTLPYGHLSNTITLLLWRLFFAGYTFPYNQKKTLMWSPVNMANGHILKSQTTESSYNFISVQVMHSGLNVECKNNLENLNWNVLDSLSLSESFFPFFF